MALSHCLYENIENSASYPVVGICMDADFRGDFICNFKAHSRYVFCQTIGVFFQHMIKSVPVFLVDFHSQIQRDPILLQEDHGLLQVFLLCHLLGNLSGHTHTDPLNFCQPLRFFPYNPQSIFFEFFYNPGCQSRPDSFNCSASQIPLHSQGVLRSFCFIRFDLELLSVHGMLRIMSPGFYPFSLGNVFKGPHTGQFFYLFTF